MRDYPPGDYHGRPVRKFPAISRVEKADVAPILDPLVPVEPSHKDRRTLFSEAAGYFSDGRWDLAIKRYRQLLFIDPENRDARANLRDIVILESLYGDERLAQEAAKKHQEIRERLAKDIAPKK